MKRHDAIRVGAGTVRTDDRNDVCIPRGEPIRSSRDRRSTCCRARV
jgi:hypothetical protein